MGVSMGLSNEKSIAFALHAENYDNVVSNINSIQKTSFETRTLDGVATWANPTTQGSMHGLTGGSADNVNFAANIEALNGNPDAMHLLGDSYAHADSRNGYKTMYKRIAGHLGIDADNIQQHQGQYNKYLDNLQMVMGLLSGSNVNADRTVFDIISKNGNSQERTDILKGFIASKVGQTYTTSSDSKNILKAFNQLGINYTINSESKRIFFGLFEVSKRSVTVNNTQKKD